MGIVPYMPSDVAPAIAARQAVDDAWFSAYHPYADHIQYLNNLVAQFPDNAELVTSGTSTEGRTITGVHIFGSSGRGVQPAIVFHVRPKTSVTSKVPKSVSQTDLLPGDRPRTGMDRDYGRS